MFIRGGPTVQVCCRPEVQPLTLLLRTIFYENLSEKGTPFVYLLLTNGTPFTNLVLNFASLLNAVLIHCLFFFFKFNIYPGASNLAELV